MKLPVIIFMNMDENHIKEQSVSLISLLDRTNEKRKYRIHILNNDLSDESVQYLYSLEKINVSICVNNVKDKLDILISKLPYRNKYNPTFYYKLLIADEFWLYNKALFISNNCIVLDNVEKLFDIEIKNKLVIGCKELSMKEKNADAFSRQVLNVKGKKYISSDMMLINCKKWREGKYTDKFLDITHFCPFSVIKEEDYFNVLIKNNVGYISNSWNKSVNLKINTFEKHNHIIRFNDIKPYEDASIPFAHYFWFYARKSPYFEKIKDNFSSIAIDKSYKKETNIIRQYQNLIKKALEAKKEEYINNQLSIKANVI